MDYLYSVLIAVATAKYKIDSLIVYKQNRFSTEIVMQNNDM